MVVFLFLPESMNRFRLKFYELYARYHLRFTCPNGPPARSARRDIYNEGECFWYRNWQAGRYNTRTFQTYTVLRKLGIDKDILLK